MEVGILILVLLLILLYVALLCLFFAYVFPFAALIGSIIATGWVVWGLATAIVAAAMNRLPAAESEQPIGPEPAFYQYFFRRAFLDLYDIAQANVEWNALGLAKTSKLAHRLIFGPAKDEPGTLWLTWPLIPVFLSVGIVGISVAVVVNVAFAVFFLATVLLVMVGNGFLLVFAWSCERAVLWPRHCSICHVVFLLPVYHCPFCGAAHRKLFPGRYGIFFRRCRCGRRLPAAYLTGRYRLPAYCPAGHRLDECDEDEMYTQRLGIGGACDR